METGAHRGAREDPVGAAICEPPLTAMAGQHMMASPHIIGIGAGIVAAVLFASLATNTTLAVLLFYVTPLPLLLARLGWGRPAGQLAFVTAAVLVGIIISLKTAVAYGIAIGLPAMLLAYLTLLNRPI